MNVDFLRHRFKKFGDMFCKAFLDQLSIVISDPNFRLYLIFLLIEPSPLQRYLRIDANADSVTAASVVFSAQGLWVSTRLRLL